MADTDDRLDVDDVRDTIAEIMRKAGMQPVFVHAFLKTGLIVCEDTPVDSERRQEWIDACNEWYDQNEPEEGGE